MKKCQINTRRVDIRLSAEEKEMLKARASKLNMSQTDFLKMCINRDDLIFLDSNLRKFVHFLLSFMPGEKNADKVKQIRKFIRMIERRYYIEDGRNKRSSNRQNKNSREHKNKN